jgi:GTPase SAR1 family protein
MMKTSTAPSQKAEASTTELAGGVAITSAAEVPANMAILQWGEAGVGKTTLACTAPGNKLLVNFDPRGPSSVAYRSDVSVADYSGHGTRIVEEFKKSDPFGLSKVIDGYDTIVVDSLTTVGDLTVARGIELNAGNQPGRGAIVERPSPAAYQARNNLILALVTNMLRLCQAHNKHLIVIAHEGAKEKDDNGQVTSIPMYLGGQLPAQTSVRFSEVWAVYELNRSKTIAIRACRNRGPIKTRMFTTSGEPEFKWSYDPEHDKGMTIASWHEQWLENGKKKIPLPK